MLIDIMGFNSDINNSDQPIIRTLYFEHAIIFIFRCIYLRYNAPQTKWWSYNVKGRLTKKE